MARHGHVDIAEVEDDGYGSGLLAVRLFEVRGGLCKPSRGAVLIGEIVARLEMPWHHAQGGFKAFRGFAIALLALKGVAPVVVSVHMVGVKHERGAVAFTGRFPLVFVLEDIAVENPVDGLAVFDGDGLAQHLFGEVEVVGLGGDGAEQMSESLWRGSRSRMAMRS